MKYLSKFLPAETLLILESENADLKELLKITFMDLLLKQVLEIITISKKTSSSRDKIRNYKYVLRGENYQNYKPHEYELVYLSPYQKSSSIKVLFQHLIRMGFQNVKNEAKYFSTVRRSQNINHCFTKSIFQKVFGGFSITQEGKELRNRILNEISQIEKELAEIIVTDKEKVKQIISVVGGNIFFLKNIDISLLKQIDSEILNEMNKKDQDGGNGCFGCSSWDSGCSGCSGSGCSGDSGCSGCGGD